MVNIRKNFLKIYSKKFSNLKDTGMIDQWMKQVNDKATTNDGKMIVG